MSGISSVRPFIERLILGYFRPKRSCKLVISFRIWLAMRPALTNKVLITGMSEDAFNYSCNSNTYYLFISAQNCHISYEVSQRSNFRF